MSYALVRCKSGILNGWDWMRYFVFWYIAAAVIHFFFVNSFLRSGKMALLVQTPARCDALLLLLLTHSTHPHNKFSNEQVSIIMHYLDVSARSVLFSLGMFM